MDPQQEQEQEQQEQQQQVSPSSATSTTEGNQITHVLNRDKKYLSEHGQKLFNAINVLLDDQEQLELTQALFKYQQEHNVFTLVRSCCELFDTSRKKSLMLFMRPVIPVRDRFHYDEYYKLFFPEEFTTNVKSIFAELIPSELLEKTLKKAKEKQQAKIEKEKAKEEEECLATIKMLEKANYDLNLDIQKLMSKATVNDNVNSSELVDIEPNKLSSAASADSSTSASKTNIEPSRYDSKNTVKIAGFRIIDLAPNENESLGFDICLGPTGTFIMISYVEPDSVVEKLGMRAGDELVSVNEISFKMIDLDQAIDILSTQATLRIVLQTSGFMPDEGLHLREELNENEVDFNNEWINPFGIRTNPPSDSKTTLKRLIRRVNIIPKSSKGLGIRIRGGIEYSLGIFISGIEPNSDAYYGGLRVSDQIIEVNGQTFSRISHENAVRVFKNSLLNYFSNRTPIKLVVRYLGKLPILSRRQANRESVIRLEPVDSKDTKINLNKNLKSLAQSNLILSEKDLLNEEIIKSKLNVHLDQTHNNSNSNNNNNNRNEEISNPKELDSLGNLFESKHEFNLFRYYFNDYLNSRINIQYFLFLISNRLLKSFKKLIESQQLDGLLKPCDKKLFKKFLNERSKKYKIDLNNLNENEHHAEQLDLDEFKRGLTTRSLEHLNEFTNISNNEGDRVENLVYEPDKTNSQKLRQFG